MKSISLRAQTGADGILHLEIPAGHANTELEVIVIMQPVAASGSAVNGWPEAFFERTAGALAETPLKREDQSGDSNVNREIE
jgi:hypothetical protein